MQTQLLDLQTVLRAIGRGSVHHAVDPSNNNAPTYWDGTGPLSLQHLGDTEGEIVMEPNETKNALTTPELTGDSEHVAFIQGENPVLTVPLFYADPALQAVISPTGNASGGYSRQRPVSERTVVVFPEELLYNATTGLYGTLAYTTADGWTVDSVALTARQEELLANSVWLWRCYWMKGRIRFRHEEAGKLVEDCTLQTMFDYSKPEGEMIYTKGDPADAQIDIDPAS